MSYSLKPSLNALTSSANTKPYTRGLILFGIAIYLFYQLYQVGWREILHSLPASPLFYLLSIAVFMIPVLAEKFAFKIVTKNKFSTSFKVFARKHVLNKAVLTYSGEAYLIHELTKKNSLTVKNAATIIKDLALIRTFVANLWVIILALVAVIFGKAQTLQNIALASPALVAVLSFICISVCLGALMFFKKISKLPYSVGAKVAGVFLLRSLLIAAIMIAQWSLAIPETSLSVWFIFMVVFSIARKSPIGGELVFISVALALPGLESQSAAVAAMLMTLLALNQVNYLLAFLTTSDFRPLRNNRAMGFTLGQHIHLQRGIKSMRRYV